VMAESLRVERLRQVIARSGTKRFDGIRHDAAACRQDDGRCGRIPPQSLKETQRVRLSRPDVANHDVEDSIPSNRDRANRVDCHRDAMSRVVEQLRDRDLRRLVVVDEKHIQARGADVSYTRNGWPWLRQWRRASTDHGERIAEQGTSRSRALSRTSSKGRADEIHAQRRHPI